MKLKSDGDSREFELELVSRTEHEVVARIDGSETRASIRQTPAGVLLKIDGRNYRVKAVRDRDAILVAVGPSHYRFALPATTSRRRSRGLTAHEITAPMPGKVLKVLVKQGDLVEAGAPLIVLEAMKMETTLAAESPAVIGKIHALAGAMVDHGAVLIELNPPPQNPSTSESAPPTN